MIKFAHSHSQKFFKCLFHHPQHVSCRCLASAAAATIDARPNITTIQAVRTAPPASHDDRTLKQIFDSSQFWSDFSRHAFADSTRLRKGLFRNVYLTSPRGFKDFAQDTLVKCRNIVAKVISASTLDGYRGMVRDLDRLSDLLCRVIDICEFVRSTHPDPEYQSAATEAYGIMFEYMNILNTTTGLHEQLKKAMAHSEVIASWSEEERNVAQTLMNDFSKSAIDLPQEERQEFVALSNAISQVGSEFLDQMRPSREYMSIETSKMKGMDPLMLKRFLNRPGVVNFPTVSPFADLALRTVEDESTRKSIYIANRTASKSSVHSLEKLLRHRARLATLSGFSSFAEMTLADKMAKSPEAVQRFLEELSIDNFQHVRRELKAFEMIRDGNPNNSLAPKPIKAWDKEYYRARSVTHSRLTSRYPDSLSAYLSLGTVMQGLSRLFSRLYGVRFVPHETSPGETWTPDVRRLDVIDEDEGHIAVLYCDLFARLGKSPNPAHFTLRCSRLISLSEIADASSSPFFSASKAEIIPAEAANDGMAIFSTSSGKSYQLPTIALICDFAPPLDSSKPTLLKFSEARTLFHEMGHAIQSILGRTELQNVSGTRCATDFAELPSVIMEDFVADEDVLSLFARHWETDAPLPYRMVAEKSCNDRRGQAADTEHQILLAILDQAYHSGLPLEDGFNSTKTFHDIHDRYGVLKEPKETSWQGFFGHLVGYGGTYYSYLFDRAIAKKMWREVFQNGKAGGGISRANGDRFRKEVLQWGGGRSGWRCVAEALKDPRLAEGGKDAMAEIGKWGLGE